MKNSKQSHDGVLQNASSVKQSHKHDANLQKNSTLYFQVGLIVCLLAALGLLEMQFEQKTSRYVQRAQEPDDTFVTEAPRFKVHVEPEQQKRMVKQERKTVMFINQIEQVDNKTVIPETTINTPDTAVPDAPFDPTLVPDVAAPVETPIVDFILVEEVPLYPGCEDEKGNEARKKCMSDKITRLVQKRFNGNDIASNYGLTGKQRIFVQFQIDKSGKISEIKTQAPHPKLGEEAERIVNKIPNMKPGMQRDKPVSVRYTLPITFMAE
jgi:protein TonB